MLFQPTYGWLGGQHSILQWCFRCSESLLLFSPRCLLGNEEAQAHSGLELHSVVTIPGCYRPSSVTGASRHHSHTALCDLLHSFSAVNGLLLVSAWACASLCRYVNRQGECQCFKVFVSIGVLPLGPQSHVLISASLVFSTPYG